MLGGTGFVGTEIVSRLAAERHWVRVPTRAASHGEHLLVLPTVEVRVASVYEPRALNELFAGADAIVNLVGILNEPGRRGAGFKRAHVEVTTRVVEAARAQHVTRVLHMSSLGADPAGPSHYLRTKYDAEAVLRSARGGLEWTIFRPSVIFGRHDSLTNRFARLLRLTFGVLPLARARARFAPLHVNDVSEAYVRALGDRTTIAQSYELCGPEVLTLEEIVRRTAAAAGLPARIIALPDALARIQAALFDFVPGKPFSTDNYRSLAIDSVCREDGCARLGIHPTAFDAAMASWLRDSGAGAHSRLSLRAR